MNRKHWQNIFHANVNVDLMEQNVGRINDGIIIINSNVSAKKHIKKNMFRILVRVFVKMKNI